MAAHVTVTLDTTAPTDVSITLESGASAVAVRDITAAIGATGSDVAQMKIWGDVDDAFAPSEYRAAEGDSPWISYAATKAIRLSSGDGSKTVTVRVRDDVNNETTTASDSITLDTSVPVITVTSGPTASKISKQTGKRTTQLQWQPDVALQAYKVKVVPNTNDPHTAGTQIPTTAGSTNVSGGAVSAGGTITVTIDGADLESASAGDGAKIVKVFGQESGGAGSWSL